MTAGRKPTRLQILWAERPSGQNLWRNSGAALLILAIAAAFVATLYFPRGPAPPQTRNFGFGPGWDCTQTGYGDPICIKRAQPAAPSQPAPLR